MFTAESVSNIYARNLFFIKQLTAGFSHADSLRQPPVRGNCANWIVGHIAAYRNRILTILEQEPTLDPAIATRYARDSAPVLGDEPGLGQFFTLIDAIEAAQPHIATGIARLTPEGAARVSTFGQNSMSAAEWMLFLLRHEAYHTGQLELLQELVKAAKASD
jgi:uncharacterized damage-inducible protein DinB